MNYRISTTDIFEQWISGLSEKDQMRVVSRMYRIEQGHFGDHKTIDGDLKELRFFFGGGIRIYYCLHGSHVVLLLNGGNKDSQKKDIQKAKKLMSELPQELY